MSAMTAFIWRHHDRPSSAHCVAVKHFTGDGSLCSKNVAFLEQDLDTGELNLDEDIQSLATECVIGPFEQTSFLRRSQIGTANSVHLEMVCYASILIWKDQGG